MYLSRKILLPAAAAMVIAGGAAIPAVALAGSSPVTYYACVTNRTGALRIVAKSARCGAGQHKISWSSAGPAGVVKGYATNNDNGSSVQLVDTGQTTVLALRLPSGRFLITATANLSSGELSADDDITCQLVDGHGALIGLAETLLHGAGHFDQQTVAIAGATTSGGTIKLKCEDSLSEGFAIDAAINAVPVASIGG